MYVKGSWLLKMFRLQNSTSMKWAIPYFFQ